MNRQAKRFSISAVCILLAVVLLAGAMSTPAIAAETDALTPEIVSYNYVLGGKLSVNFRVDAHGQSMDDYSVRVTIGNDTEAQNITAYTVDDEGLYVYTAQVMAHRLNEELTVSLLSGETVLETSTKTIAQYAQNQDSADAVLQELLDALMSYGDYAAYFKGAAIAQPSHALVEAVTAADLADYGQTILTSGPAGLNAVAALYLDEACDLRVKFNAEAAADCTLYVNGQAAELTANGTQLVYTIAELLPQDWDTFYNFRLQAADGTTVFEMDYSVLSYIRTVLRRSSNAKSLDGLMKAMYLYWSKAEAYIAANSINDELAVTLPIVAADGVVTEELTYTAPSGISFVIPVGTKVEGDTVTLRIKGDEASSALTLHNRAGYEVTVDGVAADNTAPIVVSIPGALPADQSAIQLCHDGSMMYRVDTTAQVSQADSYGIYGDRYCYNSENGDVTFSVTHFSNISVASTAAVVVDGVDLTGYETINLNEKDNENITIEADQKVILTWNSGEYQYNALTANPITAIFTNETPNPGTYYTGTITVQTGASVVLNGVNIRTDGTTDALSIYDTGANGTTTNIYVADGTRNYLVGRCGIGVDTTGTTTWGNDIVLAGGGFLCASAMQNGCPAIGPSAWNSMFDITINVGHLRAHPHKNAAGIGGGSSWRGFGDITIEGGVIQAYSGGNAAAIGSGVNGSTTSITVKAGNVYCYNQPWTATWYPMGAGVYSGSCNSITLYKNAYVYTNSYGIYDGPNGTDTLNTSGFKANDLIVDYIPTVEKFAVKFKNTDTYLYRVGNQDTVALSSLFSEISGVTVTDYSVAVKFEAISGTASGTYTAASTWENGKIQFSGLGSVKVTVTDNDYCKETTLCLEVVNAKNVATGAEFYNDSGSIVLLSDLTLTTDILYGGTVYQKGTFSGNATLYGNGFTIQTAETDTNDVGIITLKDNATLDNVSIIVADHSDVWTAGSGNPYNSAVKVESGNVTISNSFIQGGRTAVKLLGGTLNLENTVLNGGAFANLYVTAASTVNLNNVTTAQYVTKDSDGNNCVMGFGILFEQGTSGSVLNIDGTLNQYNWISSEDTKHFNYSYYEYADTLNSALDGNETLLSDGKMNLSVVWGGTLAIVDEAETGYQTLTVQESSQGNLYAYTAPANSTTGTYDGSYDPNQGIVKPEITYSFPTEKEDGDTYVYYDGTLHIGVKSGSITEVDALSNASVAGGTVKVEGDGFADGKRSFAADDAGGTLTYTAEVQGYKPDGTPADETATFTYTLEYTVEKAAWKDAELSLTPGTVMYYKGSSLSSNTRACIPVYSGWTITDYNEDGTSVTVASSSDGKSKIDGLSWTVKAYTNSDKLATFSDSSDLKKNSDIYYAYNTGGDINGVQAVTVTLTYSYTGKNGVTKTKDQTYEFKTNTSTFSSTTCIASDALITLADGTQKRADEVTGDDILLTWDFHTGSYAAAPASILFYHGHDIWTVTTLNFSDGTSVRMINEHGFFDTSVNNFVYITPKNVEEYVGHSFIKADGGEYTEVILESYTNTEEYTGSYSIQTAFYNNFIVEGMLSVTPPAYDGWFDYFNITDEMIYDQAHMDAEIAKYGLTPYENYAHLVTYEQFLAFNGQYLDILIGRGVLTQEQVYELIAQYVTG